MSDLQDNLQAALSATYSIERELGGAGMSRVFLAVEKALDRRVVIKVLPPEMGASVSMDRFRREIMLAARLQHPHIVPLLSAGESDGVPYLTMPFVEGESLRVRLARDGELPVAEGLRILREVASALDCAHKDGIVHRDIKPDNVLLSHGSAMVTDFGVAKALSASTGADEKRNSVTSLGVALGTPAYMSPEQAAASPGVDSRADIYAFGVLAYELFAGRPPFAGRSPQALLAAQITEPPEPIQKLRPSLPPALSAIIMRCLEKRAADRPQSAADVVTALDAIVTPSGGSTPTLGLAPASRAGARGKGDGSAKRRAVLGIVLGAAAALTIAAMIGRVLRSPSKTAPAGVTSIAVLPFAVGADSASQYFADGLTGELINLLAGIPSVRVVPRSTVFALKAKGLIDAATVGKTLGVSLVVEGDVRRTANAIKVSAELVDAGANAVLASRSVERPTSEVFTLEDNVAREIINAIQAKLGISIAGVTLHRGTSNEQAYDEFLKGEYFANRFSLDDYHRAIQLYQHAIALDSSFARPWAGIASAWSALADTWVAPSKSYPVAEAAARRALALDSSLAEAHANLGMVLFMYRRNYAAGYRELQRSAALDSSCAVCQIGLAYAFADFGLRDSSIRHTRRLIDIDSLSISNLSTAAFQLELVRDPDGSAATWARVSRLTGATVWPQVAAMYLRAERRTKADSIMRAACTAPDVPGCQNGLALALRGDMAGARRDFEAAQREQRSSGAYFNPVSAAEIQLAFGDTALALTSLEQALVDSTASVTEIGVLPSLRGLRSNPHFKQLIHRAGLDATLLPK